MNIGIVTTWFERGAAYVSKAYHNTLSQAHNVFIYARGEQYAIHDPNWNLPFVTWGKNPSNGIFQYIDWDDFSQWIRNNDIEIIIFNEQRNWDIILQCVRNKILIGAYIDYYTKDTVDYFQLYDFLLCNTKRHYSVFANHPQSIYIPWGTDCTIYFPTREHKIEQEIVFFHSAGFGGINLRKGTDLVIKAFSELSAKNIRLVIHSQTSIDTFKEVKEILLKDKRITFINRTIPPPGLYSYGDVFVYPSRLEGIGLTIAEALACGLPVITTDDPPMNEFVRDGYNGKLINVAEHRYREDGYYWPQAICDLDSLKASMQHYIDHPENILQQGCNARSFAIENLNWSINSQGLIDQISRLKRIRKSYWVFQRANWVNNKSIYEHIAKNEFGKHKKRIKRAIYKLYCSAVDSFSRCIKSGLKRK